MRQWLGYYAEYWFEKVLSYSMIPNVFEEVSSLLDRVFYTIWLYNTINIITKAASPTDGIPYYIFVRRSKWKCLKNKLFVKSAIRPLQCELPAETVLSISRKEGCTFLPNVIVVKNAVIANTMAWAKFDSLLFSVGRDLLNTAVYSSSKLGRTKVWG